jgi:hypothetical protein
MKIVFELDKEEIHLKIRAIHCATNNCMNIHNLDVKILSEFLTFECLMFEEFQKEIVFVMLFNLLKTEYGKISRFLIEFIVDCFIIIALKHFTIFREKDQTDEEKKIIKTIFNLFDFYMNFLPSDNSLKRKSIVMNIVFVHCFFVNYERDYCWKLMKNFLQSEPINISKYFLDIIYNESIFFNNKFCDLDDYFFYDNDEEYGLVSYFDKISYFEGLYKNFVHKVGDPNNLLNKHKIKIIKGSIFFIGMSIWGYERIEKIYIPTSIILSHFLKLLIYYSHKKIDMEIILCLRRLIRKYGEVLSDEWSDIFKIIMKITKTNSTDNMMKNLFDIMDSIKLLIISNKFFGNINQFANLLDTIKLHYNESLVMIKSQLKLSNIHSFIANLESLIIEYLLK